LLWRSTVRTEILQHGSCRHVLAGDERAPELLRWAAGVSTHLSVALSMVRALANPGAKVRRKLVASLATVGLVAPGAELWSVGFWVGTSGPRCMLRVPVGPAVIERLLLVAGSVFWSHGGWEDLAFYRDDRLVYTVLTHEHDGAVYGGCEELRALGLTPAPSADRWPVQGERFDQAYTDALLAEVAASRG
jgi:hypothetical protein